MLKSIVCGSFVARMLENAKNHCVANFFLAQKEKQVTSAASLMVWTSYSSSIKRWLKHSKGTYFTVKPHILSLKGSYGLVECQYRKLPAKHQTDIQLLSMFPKSGQRSDFNAQHEKIFSIHSQRASTVTCVQSHIHTQTEATEHTSLRRRNSKTSQLRYY